MTWVLLGILVLFIVFGMDIRKKKGMTSIVGKPFVILMKLSCVVLLGLYLHSLFQIREAGIVEWTSLILTAMGTLIVAIAKLGLRDSFSWTGHYLKDTQLITDGIYKSVRNPLYTGVFLFEAGAVTNFLFNSVLPSSQPGLLLLAGGCALAYAVGFNLLMAQKEASKLEEQFGQVYRDYRARTGAFFPRLLANKGVQKNVTGQTQN